MLSNDILRHSEFLSLARRWFFEQLTAGLLTPDEIREMTEQLDIELTAPGYAIAWFTVPPQPRDAADFFSDPAAARSAILAHFLKYSDYVLFHWGPDACAVLIKGDARRLGELIGQSIATVQTQYEQRGIDGWYIAVSDPVAGLDELPDCFREVSHLWAWRYFQPERHVLRSGMANTLHPSDDAGSLLQIDPARADPSLLQVFLENGRQEDVSTFAQAYLQPLESAMNFCPFRHYILLGARFAAERYTASLGLPREELHRRLPAWTEERAADAKQYLQDILSAALALRDEVSGAVYSGALGRATRHIQEYFTDPALTLEQTARYAEITPGYLSALFRKELGCTFTEYVTGKRIELAKRLLRTTNKRPGDIARAAGFRDSHYFSTVFKKATGNTPTKFRAGKGM